MEMNPNKLVKALRRCANGESEDCPFAGYGVCGCPEMSADQIERDQKEIEELRDKLPKWISVKERLPIDRLKKYLVAFRDAGGSIVDMARYFPSDGWTCDNWDVPQNLITHWMPLPEAPKEDNHDA